MFGILEKLKSGLSKTRDAVLGRIDAVLGGRATIDADLLEEIEEILLGADVGMTTTQAIMKQLDQRRVAGDLKDAAAVKQVIRDAMRARLLDAGAEFPEHGTRPHVIMVVGVNGVGKTTTIGKLAHRHVLAGKKVVLGAADTFRAAAVDQLISW